MEPQPSTPAPVLIVHFGEDWVRGSERCVLDLVKHIDRSRFAPRVWCNSPILARAVEATDVPATVSRFTVLLDWRAPRFAVLNYVRLVREGLRLVRRHRIRLIHANTGAPNQWMIPVARTMKIPILAHLHAIYDLRGRCIFGLHHPTRVVGVSFETIQGLRNDGVPPPQRTSSTTRRCRPAPDGRRDRPAQELGIAPDAVVIAAVGSSSRGRPRAPAAAADAPRIPNAAADVGDARARALG
jgi:hypothetical protein